MAGDYLLAEAAGQTPLEVRGHTATADCPRPGAQPATPGAELAARSILKGWQANHEFEFRMQKGQSDAYSS